MAWVFTPVESVALPVQDEEAKFPLQRVYCVGRNYAEHAQEMGHSGREDPFFFAKPAQVVQSIDDSAENSMFYPSQTEDMHHEVELVVALKAGGKDLTVEQALDCIYGYAIGLDMTRRDLQAVAKKQSRPWETSKAFDASALIGPIHPVEKTGVLTQGDIALYVNDELRQQGDLSQLIWNVAEAIAFLSRYFTLLPGDVLMTGTPAGVGAVKPGDHLRAVIAGLGQVQVTIK